MGCKQSKAEDFGGVEQSSKMMRSMSSRNSASSGRRSPTNGTHDMDDASVDPQIMSTGEVLYRALSKVVQNKDSSGGVGGVSGDGSNKSQNIWKTVVSMCETDAKAALHTDSGTKRTPLHLACLLVDHEDIGELGMEGTVVKTTVVEAMRALVQSCPEAVSQMDSSGNIPLHNVISPLPVHDASQIKWKSRSDVAKLLIVSDFEASVEYLSRNDVVFQDDSNGTNGGCTPLYHVIQSISDDFTPSPAQSTELVYAVHASSPQSVTLRNASDGDMALALLYRRFTRQFDISEKFFPGDNSRPEVVEHRKLYKLAAGNTWSNIEMLLLPVKEEKETDDFTPWRIVHRAVQVEVPPDLLRYIIETNSGELSQVDEYGNLPLHYAAKQKADSLPAFYSKYVIDELLYKYSDGAQVPDNHGKYPLTCAIESGKPWISGGAKSIHAAYPDALSQVNVKKFPHVLHALSMEEQLENEDDDDTPDLVQDEPYVAIMLVQDQSANLENIVSAMWANEEDPGIQMLGCVAIDRLAQKASDAKSQNNNDVLQVALSGVGAVVNAMKAHPNEPIVQEKSCAALKNLACCDGKREVSMVASGAVASLVGAMQAHVDDPSIQEEACAAIANIVSTGGADRATVVASVSGFTAILNSMGAHNEVLGVQREACRALKILTDYQQDANLPALPTAQTGPLLKFSEKMFPADCGENAGIVLSRLS